MRVLELANIYRSYQKGIPVLEGVDLALEAGEVVGLLGENGAGKTTLIKIALGMLYVQGGSARLFGLDPRARPVEVKRRVGYVSEDQPLPPYLRVRDVLAIHRSLFPSWDEHLERQLSRRFSFSGKEKIGKLSKGQARRVSVLCAIAHRPELLLLDEPAGGLDPAARREFLETALELLAENGTAILFSSHNMGDVERIAERVVLLHGGRVLVDQELDRLREETTLALFPAGNGVALEDLRGVEGWLAARRVEDELRGIFQGPPEAVAARLAALSPAHPASCRQLSLEDLFIEIAEGRR